MKSVRKLLAMPLCSAGQLVEFTLTTVGIVSLVVGLFVLPTLELNETGFYVSLLVLVAFMILCFCAGQLAVIRERITGRDNA